MSTVNLWKSVGVNVQTVAAAAKTLTGITKAPPGVVTSVAHGYNDGDLVWLEITGMYQLNNMVARVDNKTADTFELEGIDTSSFGTFAAGTAKKITFGASAGTFVDVSASGGEADSVDITTIHDSTKKELPGAKSALSYAFQSLWDPTDAALVELKEADDTTSPRCVEIVFSSGAKVYFNAYVSCPNVPTGSKGEAVQTPVSFKLQGAANAYAS